MLQVADVRSITCFADWSAFFAAQLLNKPSSRKNRKKKFNRIYRKQFCLILLACAVIVVVAGQCCAFSALKQQLSFFGITKVRHSHDMKLCTQLRPLRLNTAPTLSQEFLDEAADAASIICMSALFLSSVFSAHFFAPICVPMFLSVAIV